MLTFMLFYHNKKLDKRGASKVPEPPKTDLIITNF